jgi:hypothetical protein
VWDHDLKTVLIGGAIDRRLFTDRVSARAGATWWSPVGQDGATFHTETVGTTIRSSNEQRGFVGIALIRADVASANAPLAIWPGAGEGRVRSGLLRAHPLLDDGAVDGPAFGRHVQSATFEVQRWLAKPTLPRVGVSVFADAAHTSYRLAAATNRPFQLDIGAGVRFRLPGSDRTLRVDYAHGLRDRTANAVTVGWVP